MAHSVSTDGNSLGSNFATFFGSWSGFVSTPDAVVWFDYGIGSLTNSTSDHAVGSGNSNGSWSQIAVTSFDRGYIFKAKGRDDFETLNGSTLSFQSSAESVQYNVDTTVASGPTQTTCGLTATIDLKVIDSFADVYVEYKRNVDPGYTSVLIASSQQGIHAYPYTITGLTPGTLYDVRYKVLRSTSTGTSSTSTNIQFTTRAAQTVSTQAATNVTQSTADLNGTVNAVNSGNSVNYYFQWGLTTGYGNTTATQGPTSSTSNVLFQATISGLVSVTTYHFRAVAATSEWTVYGSDQSFTTQSGDKSVMRL